MTGKYPQILGVSICLLLGLAGLIYTAHSDPTPANAPDPSPGPWTIITARNLQVDRIFKLNRQTGETFIYSESTNHFPQWVFTPDVQISPASSAH